VVTQAHPTDLLGIGVYTPAEAAFYARIPTQTMCRWLWGVGDNKPVYTPEIEGDKLVSFVDFVTAMAIRAIRVAKKGVSLQKVRDAIQIAEDDYNLSNPLARKHEIFLLRDDVVISLEGEGDKNKRLVQLTGKHKRNLIMRPIAESFLFELKFGDDGLASMYTAYTYRQFDVQLNPKVRFGEPLVSSTGYSALALWEAFRDEGSLEGAARAYGVDVDAVHAACRFYDHLTPTPSA
jgi:uncharacterized protein (DUF433 family)